MNKQNMESNEDIIIYNINIAGICEVLPLALMSGLKSNVVEQVLTTASSKSFASEYFVHRLLDRNFESDFPMESAYKDIENVQNGFIVVKSNSNNSKCAK